MNKEKTLIIAVAHQKGGTGKTTTVCNLAACFGMAGDGLRVAVIDLDAQGTATSHLNGASYFSSDSYQVITGTKSVSEVALPTGIKNCFIVPSTDSLVLCEMDPTVRGLSFKEVREHMLGKADAFDVIIIDCPSGLGIISTIAIAIADLVVMPTPPLAFAEEPLRTTVDYINGLQKNTDSGVAIVLTMYEPKIDFQEKSVRQIRDEWGKMVVDVEIPFETLAEDAVENNAVIVEFEKHSAIATAYMKLAEDLGKRLGLKLDLSKLTVNSLGTNLAHGLGKLIEQQTEAGPSVLPGVEDSHIEEPPQPAILPVTHKSDDEKAYMETPAETQPASPGESGENSSLGKAVELLKQLDGIQEPEDYYPPKSMGSKINIFKFMYKVTVYIILILSFIIVSIFIP